MLIVIEGIDRSGKTTLARRLVEHVEEHYGFTGEVWHRGVPRRHPLQEYELDLEQDYPSDPDVRETHLIVCDRWHLGEKVYGELYRGKSKLGDGGLWHVDALLQSRGAVQLILSPPPETVLERMARDGEDYLQTEHVQHVLGAYKAISGTFSRSMVRFTRDIGAIDVRDLVWESIKKTKTTRGLARFPSYVGPVNPKILLLGERRGPMDDRYRAAFVPYPATSGGWLCETIAGTRLAEIPIGLANACEENVTELVCALGSPRVVALGNEASDECGDSWCDHGKVPHPQWVRRFRHRDRDEYAQAIIHAAETHREVNPWQN